MEDRLDPALLVAELQLRRDDAATSLDEAVWSLALGEPKQGLDAIRRHLEAAPEEERHGVRWTQLAVLAGDWETAARGARSALPDLDYVPGYLEYAAAMLCLIAGDEDEARAYVEQLEEHVAGRAKLRSGHPAAVTEIPRGLLERDAGRVAAGVEALLAWHVRRARARSEIFNSTRSAISLDAIVALLLGHRLGLAVPVAAKYRSARVPLLALHLTEWEGRPLPRGLPLSLDADLVAGAWLQSHGLALEEAPSAPRKTRAPRMRSRGQADVGEDFARQSLRVREHDGGAPWQLASWALLLGDGGRARSHLQRAAVAARRRWQETAPPRGRSLRWLWHSQALPNHNYVREHFALALLLGDEDALAETMGILEAWAQVVEDDQRRRGHPPYAEGRYGHAAGYLDLLGAVLAARPLTRADGELVRGPLSSTRVACVGLVERNPTLLRSGLDGMLAQHAEGLERRSAPPPSLCESAAHVAATASRVGLSVEVDERYSSYPVPIEVRNLPGLSGRLGRLPGDLLARELWAV